MKNIMVLVFAGTKRIAAILMMLLLVTLTISFAGAEPTLKKASIQFHTGSDDKDKDTKLSVWIMSSSKTIARKVGFANDNKRFAENASSENFDLGDVDTNVTKSDVANGVKTRILFETKDGGDDNWWTKWTLTFEFSDGSTITALHAESVRFDDDEFTDGTWTDKP